VCPKAVIASQPCETAFCLIGGLVQATICVRVVEPALHRIAKKNNMGNAGFEDAKQINIAWREQRELINDQNPSRTGESLLESVQSVATSV
jgi:hypothetical protein